MQLTSLTFCMYNKQTISLKTNNYLPNMPKMSKKREIKLCEICDNVADRTCKKCLVTHYCSIEHKKLDYESIHEKCCSLIKELRDTTIYVSIADRQKRKQRKNVLIKKLLNCSLKQSESFLMSLEHEFAIPCSLQSLKCARIIFGESDIRLIPILLTLSRACLGAFRIEQSEQFLSMGKLIMHKNQCQDYLLQSQFHRLYGRLHAMCNNFDQSLKQLSLDVYYSSLAAGPQHIRTAAGFYQISQVLLKLQKTESALEFYTEIVEIWLNFLMDVEENQMDIVSELGKSQLNEAMIMLQMILEANKNFRGLQHMQTGKSFYVLGILNQMSKDIMNAKKYFIEACLFSH